MCRGKKAIILFHIYIYIWIFNGLSITYWKLLSTTQFSIFENLSVSQSMLSQLLQIYNFPGTYNSNYFSFSISKHYFDFSCSLFTQISFGVYLLEFFVKIDLNKNNFVTTSFIFILSSKQYMWYTFAIS